MTVNWINLQPENGTKCRRIYTETDVILPPREETSVPVRIVRSSLKDVPFVGVTENRKIPSLSHVYSGRSVIPAKFKDLRICVVNTDKRIQTIPKGTPLGIVERAEVLESAETTSASGTENQTPKGDVLRPMTDSLPDELTKEQRTEMQQLL